MIFNYNYLGTRLWNLWFFFLCLGLWTTECTKQQKLSGVAPANQSKERSVHELSAGAFRNKSSMWIVLVSPKKNTRIHKNGWNSWTFRFGPLVWFAGATPETPKHQSCANLVYPSFLGNEFARQPKKLKETAPKTFSKRIFVKLCVFEKPPSRASTQKYMNGNPLFTQLWCNYLLRTRFEVPFIRFCTYVNTPEYQPIFTKPVELWTCTCFQRTNFAPTCDTQIPQESPEARTL